MHIDAVLAKRRSVRAFRAKTAEREPVEAFATFHGY
jgi:hypothetical protein